MDDDTAELEASVRVREGRRALALGLVEDRLGPHLGVRDRLLGVLVHDEAADHDAGLQEQVELVLVSGAEYQLDLGAHGRVSLRAGPELGDGAGDELAGDPGAVFFYFRAPSRRVPRLVDELDRHVAGGASGAAVRVQQAPRQDGDAAEG